MNQYLIILLLVVCTPKIQGSEQSSHSTLRQLTQKAMIVSSDKTSPTATIVQQQKKTNDQEEKLLCVICSGIFFGSLILALTCMAGLINHIDQTMNS